MPRKTPEQQLLLSQIKQVAEGLAQTFAPFTEVVVHDLLDPQHAVLAIHNNLSGREVGQPATELGLARIMDPAYEQIIANYPNQFADGRQVKSTSIGSWLSRAPRLPENRWILPAPISFAPVSTSSPPAWRRLRARSSPRNVARF
jgi:hypothetical protein